MTGAVTENTANLGLRILAFNFPNWGDDANTNMKIIDASFGSLGIATSGIWENSRVYIVGEIVIDVSTYSYYRVLVSHTSALGGTFAADRTLHPTYWQISSTIVQSRGQWTTATAYYPNDIVYLGYQWAISTDTFISRATLAADITAGDFVVMIDFTSAVAATTASGATATAQAGIATAQAVIAATQAGIATTQAGIATTQAGLATTNGAAQVALAAAQVALSTTQANLATTNGAAQVALAATQAGNAATSASGASTSATTATTQASNASTSASNASTSASNASTSATNAAASAVAAAASASVVNVARSLQVAINGGGAVISSGLVPLDVEVPYNCTIVGARILSTVSGSIVINIYKDTYANFPPVVGDKITASAPPTLSTNIKSQDTTLTGWTTSMLEGDILRFNVDSVTNVVACTLVLDLVKV